ncbi:MAG: gamma carbonic anhydrase family protein [Crocinitomicaceae bacterium]|nr:gamma carbonic anhydrase family protein [Crocinitomicaceae bacterium]
MNTPSSGLVLSCRNFTPQIHKSCWLAPNATVIGQVTMDEDSNCWFNAVIRGDVSPISIGKRVNIQDGAVIHGTLDKSETIIDDDASIGHNAIVHGAHVQSHALVGMGSIVMDGAVVGKGAVIAAGAVVLEGTHVPAGSLWAGVPAQERGRVSESLKQSLSETSNRYVRYSHWFK